MSERIEMVARQTVLGKEVMVYGTAENPLFLARDVAEWIDYAKTGKGAYEVSRMLDLVDEDEKLILQTFVSGQNRDCWFLTEEGLYEVLMQSQKPIAKQFKKEVKRILHELRVNGTVVSSRVAMASPEEQAESFQRALDNAVQHAMEIAENWFAPKIERAEAERDEAIRTKAWIADRQTATAMQTASAKARRVARLEREKAVLEERIDEIEEELGEERYDAERYRSWRSKVGRPPKGYVRPEDDDRFDLF
jgi:prophage antirepressor-like protein